MLAPGDAAAPPRRNLRSHAFGAALALASAGALAQSCTVAPGATLAFPVIVALASTGDQATDTGQSLQVACDSGVAGALRLYSGTARVMSNGTHSLPFNLSRGSGAANNDLPALSPGASFDIIRDGQSQTVILYARIFARDFKSLPAGPYSASIILTVEY
jgi:spore coat protein U-like protein